MREEISLPDFLKLIIALLSGTAGSTAGIALGWLMAYLLSGPLSAEQYVRGLKSYRLTGLSGLELLYFIAGYSLGTTVAALCIIRWLRQKKRDY